MIDRVIVIGAGLAGAEAAWQIASRGIPVELHEMKPMRYSPAHHYAGFAELVCSNSLRSSQLSNAVGLLKEELSRMGSLIMEAAHATAVPAGSALAVDRVLFSDYVTDRLRAHPLITIVTDEVSKIDPEHLTVVASGPLTDGLLAQEIARLSGGDSLSFYDAVAPIVDFTSVDMSIAYFATRYGKGDPEDYLNCPMTREEYDAFYEALISAEEAPLKEFDLEAQARDITVFEGCMPVEVMAKRGYDTLRYGPMKPVGLPHPVTGEEAYAVVQLRRENTAGTMYNLVGFQTHLTFGAQKRVFGMIPGLQNAEFLRYGVMHRNTYLSSPGKLAADYSMRQNPNLYFAGQMTGVEGYVESASSGFVAGVNAARAALGKEPFYFPRETVIGSLAAYVSEGGCSKFAPMNANFGIVPPLAHKVKGGKRFRNEAYAERSISLVKQIVTEGF